MEGEGAPVVVIGAGIVGLSTAYFLHRAGIAVTVVDRAEVGQGASFGNAGAISAGSVAPVAYPGLWRDVPRMLLDPAGPLRVTPRGLAGGFAWLTAFLRASSPAAVAKSAEAIAPLLRDALARHREVLADIGHPALLAQTGQLQLYPDRQAYGKDATGWALRRQHGVTFFELPREEFLQYEPAVGPAYGFGVYLPEQGMVVNPHRYCLVLAEHLAREGVAFVRDEVTSLAMEGARVAAIVGRAGRYPCSGVVLCAGAWSARLVAAYGYRIPLINQRGYHVTFGDAGVAPRRVVVAADRKVFITPMEAGLRVAGTVEIAPLDSAPHMRRADYLVDHARRVFPNLQTEQRETWSGERPCLPDSLPVIGASREHRNLWFNFGHGHLGLTASAPAGALIADAMTTGNRTDALQAFSYRRFAG